MRDANCAAAVEQDVLLRSRLPVVGDENDAVPFGEQHQGRFFNLARAIPEARIKKLPHARSACVYLIFIGTRVLQSLRPHLIILNYYKFII